MPQALVRALAWEGGMNPFQQPLFIPNTAIRLACGQGAANASCQVGAGNRAVCWPCYASTKRPSTGSSADKVQATGGLCACTAVQ
jgi:hypothetical protein